MINGFRYHLFGSTTRATFNWFWRPTQLSPILGVWSENNTFPLVVADIPQQFRDVNQDFNPTPSVDTSSSQNYEYFTINWDDNAGKYQQAALNQIGQYANLPPGSNALLFTPDSGQSMYKLNAIENLLDPQQEVIYQGTSPYSPANTDGSITALNCWGVDVDITTVDPSVDLWYGQPDCGKYGWIAPCYNINVPTRYGQFIWINFSKQRILLPRA